MKKHLLTSSIAYILLFYTFVFIESKHHHRDDDLGEEIMSNLFGKPRHYHRKRKNMRGEVGSPNLINILDQMFDGEGKIFLII